MDASAKHAAMNVI